VREGCELLFSISNAELLKKSRPHAAATALDLASLDGLFTAISPRHFAIMASRSDIRNVVRELEQTHGKPKPPRFNGPLEMILWENVVYLADDKQRQAAFDALRNEVGLTAAKVLAASPGSLLAVSRMAGILPNNQVEKLRRIAQIVLDEFAGDLDQVLKQPLEQAKRSLKKFPGIGEPGAEKILLFCGAYPIFALESNGLRVLLRLGFGTEQKNYAASYRSAQAAVTSQLKMDGAWLIRAHQLLRQHGQEICRRSRPLCEICPLTKVCHYYHGN
jgi:endonuclease III